MKKQTKIDIDPYIFKSNGISIGFNFSFDVSNEKLYIDFQFDFIKWWFGISFYIRI